MPRKDKPRTEARCFLFLCFFIICFLCRFYGICDAYCEGIYKHGFFYFTGTAKAPGQLCRLQPQHSCLYMYLVIYVDHFSGHVGTFQVDKDKVFKRG